MVRVEVINEDFTLQKFDELKNIVRKNRSEKGKLFIGDTFECNDEMVTYLGGDNDLKKSFIKIIEVLPTKKKKGKKRNE